MTGLEQSDLATWTPFFQWGDKISGQIEGLLVEPLEEQYDSFDGTSLLQDRIQHGITLCEIVHGGDLDRDIRHQRITGKVRELK